MACKNPTVRVAQGELRGVLEENLHGGSFLAFRGIPYAKPPTGPLKFKDPEPAEPWTGVRDALEFGDICAQLDFFTHQFIGSDDCLHLNVYTPSIDASSKRAVMVWIHGGAFVHGSGNSDIYGPDHLVRKDIVLVTINYRLGILGFLNLEDKVATGNQGLKDQVMALKWVKDNIASFGGDPNNVTIFGESAGAASVHYLTISPLAKGLFHKAIAQSGVVANPWAHIAKDTRKNAIKLAASLGKDTTDPEALVKFLRTVDPEKLVNADNHLLTPEEKYVRFGVFIPSIDDKSPNPFMPQHPMTMMKAGVKLPFMIGHNTNEGSMFTTPFLGPNAAENLRKLGSNFEMVVVPELEVMLKKDGVSPNDLKRIYFGNGQITPDMKEQYANYMSDTMFLRGIYDVLKVQADVNNHSTYFYKFTYDCEDSIAKRRFNVTLPGTAHAEDLAYLFYPYLMKLLGVPPAKSGTTQYKVMEYFTQMWTDFAKTGKPTPMTTNLIPTIWKPIECADAPNYMAIGDTLRMEAIKKEDRTFEWGTMKNKL